MEEEFRKVNYTKLISGRNYFDIDDAEYGSEMKFVKYTIDGEYLFKPLKKCNFYNTNSEGLICFRVAMFLTSFYEKVKK